MCFVLVDAEINIVFKNDLKFMENLQKISFGDWVVLFKSGTKNNFPKRYTIKKRIKKSNINFEFKKKVFKGKTNEKQKGFKTSN